MSIVSEIREKSDEAQNNGANFIKSLDQSRSTHKSFVYWPSYLAVPGDLMALCGVSMAKTSLTRTVVQNSTHPPKTTDTCLKHTTAQVRMLRQINVGF